jgi:acetylornithine aminotransferase/putrescine aminotransferase
LSEALVTHGISGSVRGEGLMVGLELPDPESAGEVLLEAAKRGVLLSFCLSKPEVLRVFPPACMSRADLDAGLARIADALLAASAKLPVKDSPCPQ